MANVRHRSRRSGRARRPLRLPCPPPRRSPGSLDLFGLWFLEDRQIPVELPARQLDAVVVPLLALQLDVAVENVRPERFPRELGLGQRVDRLAQRLRQRDDASLPPLLWSQVIEV